MIRLEGSIETNLGGKYCTDIIYKTNYTIECYNRLIGMEFDQKEIVDDQTKFIKHEVKTSDTMFGLSVQY